MQEQGKLNDAIRLYQEAIKLNPHHVDAHYNLGSAWQVSSSALESQLTVRAKLDGFASRNLDHWKMQNTSIRKRSI
jgi:tetratricopeptide (TPR) repeat protein